MSQPTGESGQQDGSGQATVTGKFPAAPQTAQTAQETGPGQAPGERRPTFSAAASGPATSVPAGPGTTPGTAGTTDTGGQAAGSSGPDGPPVTVPAQPTGPAGTRSQGVLTPALGEPDGPLLGDAAGLRAGWQRAQSGFIDDPQAAVADAAELVEHTAQALIGALRQRQRQLRTMWDRGSADGTAARVSDSGESGSAAAGGVPDTEQLRLMMQRYRALFNQICLQ